MSSLNKLSIPKHIFENIFFKEGGKKSLAKAMTGDYQYGLDEKNPIAPINAEVEKDEYIKDSFGLRKVEGKTHEKGGVKVSLEEGSEVLSDHLKLGSGVAKRLSKDFGLSLAPKDTYATALDKYNKKIGYTSLSKEMEGYITKLDKAKEKTKDGDYLSESTLTLNTELLSNKIYDLQKKKETLLPKSEGFFGVLFNEQEIGKEVQVINEFELGGEYSDDILRLAQKYRVPGDKLSEIIPKLQNGIDDFEVTQGDNPNRGLPKVPQSATDTAYGLSPAEKSINALYRNFPDLVLSDDIFKKNLTLGDDGILRFKDKVPLNKENPLIKKLQEKMHARMTASADLIINNPSIFGEGAVTAAKEYKTNETFDLSLAREFDGKLGNFTSGRFSLGLNLVTPKEKAELASKGIYTIKQLVKSGELANLSTSSQGKVNKIHTLSKDTDTDFSLNIYEEAKAKEGDEEVIGVEAKAKPLEGRETKYGFLPLPYTTPMLPPPLLGHLNTNRRYDKINPTLISPEQQLSEINRESEASRRQIDMLPPSQRVGAIASLGAATQDMSAKIVADVNRYNAQAKDKANLYNAQTQVREEDSRANDALNYERRQLTALDNFQQNMRNRDEKIAEDTVRNWNTVNKFNAFNALNPEVQYTGTGYEVYNPYIDPATIRATMAMPKEEEGKKKKKADPKAIAIKKKGGKFNKRFN